MHLCESQAHARIESLWSISRWDAPVFIEYLENALAAKDPAEREEWIKKMDVRYLEQVPEIFLPVGGAWTIWWPWVKNYYGEAETEYATLGTPFARIWIDQELKKEMGY